MTWLWIGAPEARLLCLFLFLKGTTAPEGLFTCCFCHPYFTFNIEISLHVLQRWQHITPIHPCLRCNECHATFLNQALSLIVPDYWWLHAFLLATEVESGSLTRLGSSRLLPSNLRTLQSTVSSSLNPEGIYVWPPTRVGEMLFEQGDLMWPGLFLSPGKATNGLPKPLRCSWVRRLKEPPKHAGGKTFPCSMNGISQKHFTSFWHYFLLHITRTEAQTDVSIMCKVSVNLLSGWVTIPLKLFSCSVLSE